MTADDRFDEDAGNFRDLIVHTTRCTLELVQQAGSNLSPAEREQAKHILSYALNLDAAWSVARELLLLLAPKMELLGHRFDWIPYLQAGIEKSQHYQERKVAAEYQLQLGILYHLVNEYDQAKQALCASVEHFVAENDQRGEARALNELGWVEHLQQDHRNATSHAQKALRLLAAADPERGMSYRVLGMIANNEQRWADALGYHQESHKLFLQANDRRKLAWSLQNIALALRSQNQFEAAIAQYQEAARMLQALGDLHRWVMTQIGLGATYYHSGDTGAAIPCFLQVEPFAKQLGDNLLLAMIQTNLGLCWLAEQNFAQAEVRFQNAIALYQVIGNLSWQLNAVDGLAMAYLGQFAYAQAIAILEEAIARLPAIHGLPNHAYLQHSLHQHLAEAQNGL